MTTTATLRQRSATVLVLTVFVAAAFGVAGLRPADAAEESVDGAELRWSVSTYVWGSSSLSTARGTTAPAIIDGGQFVFPEGTGTYDPDTGATEIAFDGEMYVGNTVQGNYGVRWTEPRVVVDGSGAGQLVAEVATRGPGSATWATAGSDVVVVTFDVTDAVDDDGSVTWTVTPHFPVYDWEAYHPDWEGEPLHGFDLDFLDRVGGALNGHFRETLSGTPPAANANNPNKPPAPLTLSFEYESSGSVPDGPSVTVDPLTGADPDGQDFHVQGSGFDVTAPGIYVAFGVASGSWWLDAGAFQEAVFVPHGELAPDGAFDLVLEDVTALYESSSGTVDCRQTQCSVVTMKAHGSPDRTQDTVTHVTFVGGENPNPPTPPPPPATVTPGGSVGGDLTPGGTGIVTLWGFGPSTAVDGWLFSEPESLGSAITDAAGTVNFAFTVPEPGEHRIEGHGVDAAGEPIVVTVWFTVDADEAGGDMAQAVPAAAQGTPSGSLPFTGASGLGIAAGAALLVALGAMLARARRPAGAREHG